MGSPHPSRTVLIVEDNRDNRTIYRTILEYFGFRVLEAVDGAQGVRHARELRPDLVLMDISIPIIDGHQATRILKADPATASIPIIALTAHNSEEDRELAVSAGCDAYIAKPGDPNHVAAEVTRLLGG